MAEATSNSVSEKPLLSSVKPDQKIALKNETARAYHPSEFRDDQFELRNVSRDDSRRSLGIFTFQNVLTAKECFYLRNVTESEENLSFWNSLGRENENARLFRDADTVEVVHEELADMIWSRIQHLIDLEPIEIQEDDVDHPLYERELPGKWTPVGMNQNFLFAIYPQGGHFAPHTDGREIHREALPLALSSHLTVSRLQQEVLLHRSVIFERHPGPSRRRNPVTPPLLCLPHCPSPLPSPSSFYHHDVLSQLTPSSSTGQWTCPTDSLSAFVLTEVFSTLGSLLIFDQRLVHEGVPCSPPPHPFHKKYIIRSDVMFERLPPVVFSPHDAEAYRLFKEAEGLAELNKVDESIVIFKRACKMSPLLAAMMGH
jgi:hypothetical protein